MRIRPTACLWPGLSNSSLVAMLSAKEFLLQMPDAFEDNGENADDNRKLFKIVHFGDLIYCLTKLIKKGYIC